MGTRRIWLFGLLVVATLFVCSASATYCLPDSSYEDGAWQGGSIYRENGFNVLTDFTVYDVANLQLADENALAEQLNAAGQHIYTYQIFNYPNDMYEEIVRFGALNIDGAHIDEAPTGNGIGCHSDCSWTVTPMSKGGDIRGDWVWTTDGGYISQGRHPRFLVFR